MTLEFENLDIESLRSKAKFYLDSAVRGEAEIERLQQEIADARAALEILAEGIAYRDLLIDELTQPPPGEVDVVLNPTTGVYE